MPSQAKTLFSIARKLAVQVRALRADQYGVSAIEFAFFAGLLAFAMLNVADIAIYVYKRMQVENATEMGAQAANVCNIYQLPATLNCGTNLTTAVSDALQSTSLGTQVSLQSGYPSEGWYCMNSGSSLTEVAAVSSNKGSTRPKCSDGTPAADYISIRTTYSYAPLFPNLTVASAFSTPITSSAMMRLE